MVVAKLLLVSLVGAQHDRARGRIVLVDDPEPKVGAMKDVPQRRYDVARLKRARRCLRQERGVEEEIDVVYERQPRRLARQESLELARRRHPPESAADDDDVPGHRSDGTLRAFVVDGGLMEAIESSGIDPA